MLHEGQGLCRVSFLPFFYHPTSSPRMLTALFASSTLTGHALSRARSHFCTRFAPQAVPRFWYLNDATGAIPDHVHARESMQVSVCRSHVYLYAYAICCLDLCVFSFLHYTLPSPFAGCLFGILLLSPCASALLSHPFGDFSHELGTHLTICFRMWQSRLEDSVRYEHMTVDSLKLLCKRRQLKVSGTKHELIRKLIQPQPSDRIPPPHPPPAADQGSSISDRVRGERDPANKGFQGHELPSMDFVRAHTQQRNTHTHTHTHTAAMHQSFVHLLSLLPLTGLSRLAPYYRIWACYALRSPQKIHT